ncbi:MULTISPECIES: hypothetical protein [unclassified Pseudomonas]|uniref:hypothetical protein n=1 Tax=unclassified Pseudomonas TaxID=196821 RepID=UPI000CD2368B|nr:MULTISPECIES: hypothetical protein [unclassified Pseudomonas]POA56494.1 hypothetical protein C1889_10480 [Pseudomonas sp. FW507-12TSA]
MNLSIEFPSDMRTEQLLRQVRIPCLCRISSKFEVSFSDTVPISYGVVLEWDRKELELRAVAGGGGQYTHYANSLITLREIKANLYKIIDLEMFYTDFGWCVVLKDGEYAPPGNFWDEE